MRGNFDGVTQGFPDNLPRLITKAASKQTYYTIRWLVDRDRVSDAYRAYAYFRWLDDTLDRSTWNTSERIAFVNRQRAIMECSYEGEPPGDLPEEEHMLVSLIQNDREPSSGLQSYIRNMMEVMTFDAERRGRLVSEQELTNYSHHLAVAVTEAVHHFMGHGDPTPQNKSRYLATTAAHIVHMLRDATEDVALGYFNIPCEWVEFYRIDPCALKSIPYRAWVKRRVQLARAYFREARNYLSQVRNFRSRLAGYAYIARFEGVLHSIERDNYRLRPDYGKGEALWTALRMFGTVSANVLGLTNLKYLRGEQ